MCILLTSTLHPDYPFLLLSNRDEYFARPTELATLRPLKNGTQILSPLDLGRPERGTWIGITDTGKVAVLVNYREESNFVSEVSRGILPLQYLTSDLEDDDWYESLEKNLSMNSVTGGPVSLEQIGGFTLMYGKLELDSKGSIKPLNIMSNRGDKGRIHSYEALDEIPHFEIACQPTFGLSNSLFYSPWPKVTNGASKMGELVEKSVEHKYTQEDLVEACFELLSTDTFDPEIRKDTSFSKKLQELPNSIFIPPLETNYDLATVSPMVGKYYGTRTQTVIMLHKSGTLHYYERDLHLDDTSDVHIRNQHYMFDTSRK